MPPRLYVSVLSFMSKWLTTMAASEGVGLKHEHDTITMSTCTQALSVKVQKRPFTKSSDCPPCWQYSHRQRSEVGFKRKLSNLRGPHGESQQALKQQHGLRPLCMDGCVCC